MYLCNRDSLPGPLLNPYHIQNILVFYILFHSNKHQCDALNYFCHLTKGYSLQFENIILQEGVFFWDLVI